MEKRKYKTDERKLICTSGWPKPAGYPHCETKRGSEMNSTAPNFFVYCSPPAPVQLRDISGTMRRPKYRNNTPKPRGVHSYYNLMWDGRVCRGDPIEIQAAKAAKEELERSKILQRLNQPRVTKSFVARKSERKSRVEEVTVQSEVLRYSQLAISTLCPKDPDKYLVDLSDEIDAMDPCYKGRRLQTLRTFPRAPARKPNLEDFGTQIFPGDFFDFEGEAQPIIERLIGAAVDQAHLELLEEEEIEALRIQQENYEKKKEKALKTLENWMTREARREAEKKRLRDAELWDESGMDEAMKLYHICAYSGGMTKDAIEECMESLRKEGFIVNQSMVEQEFIPWINEEVEMELQIQNTSRNFLDGLIVEVVTRREAEYAEAIWREVYEDDPFTKYGGNGAPPPTPGTSLFEGESEDEEDEEETEMETDFRLPKD